MYSNASFGFAKDVATGKKMTEPMLHLSMQLCG
jgi:hypothetical protein